MSSGDPSAELGFPGLTHVRSIKYTYKIQKSRGSESHLETQVQIMVWLWVPRLFQRRTKTGDPKDGGHGGWKLMSTITVPETLLQE